MEKDTIDTNISRNIEGMGENSIDSIESSDSSILSSSSEKSFLENNEKKTDTNFHKSKTSSGDGILNKNNVIHVKINNLECTENSDFDIIVPANKKFVIICTLCKKSFFKMPKLKKHLKTHDSRKIISNNQYKFTVDTDTPNEFNVCQQSYYSNLKGSEDHIKIETDIIDDNIFTTIISRESNNLESNASLKSNTILSFAEQVNCDNIKIETDIADIETQGSDDTYNDVRYTKEIKDEKCAKNSKFDATRPTKHVSIKICDICNESFLKKFQLRKHMKIHMKDHSISKETISDRSAKKFKCSDCNKCFTALSTMKMHMRIFHTEKKSYKCNNCDKSFSDTVYLKRHIKYHDEKKPHKCKICQKSFPIASSLRVHMNVHTGVKPWRCDICDKSYSDRTAYKKHMQYHNEGYSFKCKLCNHVFNRKNSLSKHILVHSNVNPVKKRFECKTCEKYFSTAFRLKRHMHVHTGEKQFICDICKKSFVEKGHLKRHVTIVHAVKKPYKCNVCKKLFSDPEYFKIHKTLHTNKKPFKCNHCAKSFSHKKFLKCHSRDIHNS